MTTVEVTHAEDDVQFEMIPHWILLHDDLTAQDVRTYGVLRRYASMPKGAIPSHAALADDCQCSVSTVRRSIDRLKGAGAVEVNERKATGERQKTNLYVVRTTKGGVHQRTGGVFTGEQGGVVTSEQRSHTEVESHRVDTPLTSGLASRPDPADQFDDDVVRLTRRFATLVYGNGHTVPAPGSKANRAWYDDMRKLLDLGLKGEHGERAPDPETVEAVMEWALTISEFWPANIRSPGKFRHQWSRLVLQARQQMRPSAEPTGLDAVLAYAQEVGL